MKKLLKLKVNGEEHQVAIDPHRTLVQVLREDIGLTGTKIGCGEGDCGACTVLLDGRAVNSCLLLAVQAEGHEITTIEGLAEGNRLHPIQQAFVEHGAIQCGFCSPGMILTAKQLLDRNPAPSETEVRAGIVGNLCRCTGYQKIVEATLDAADRLSREERIKK
jgi:carbon-monoxide dehydrogenase small subunit